MLCVRFPNNTGRLSFSLWVIFSLAMDVFLHTSTQCLLVLFIPPHQDTMVKEIRKEKREHRRSIERGKEGGKRKEEETGGKTKDKWKGGRKKKERKETNMKKFQFGNFIPAVFPYKLLCWITFPATHTKDVDILSASISEHDLTFKQYCCRFRSSHTEVWWALTPIWLVSL